MSKSFARQCEWEEDHERPVRRVHHRLLTCRECRTLLRSSHDYVRYGHMCLRCWRGEHQTDASSSLASQ
jgi:hypothetical protein